MPAEVNRENTKYNVRTQKSDDYDDGGGDG